MSRRTAALVVMIIAAGAAAATSAPTPRIQSHLTGSTTLDAATPVLVLRIGIRVSPEALGPEVLHGGVEFDVPGDGLGDGGLFGGRTEPSVRVTAIPDDPALLPDSVRTREDGGEFFNVDSCPTEKACETEYTIVVERIEPVEGESLTIDWEIEASVSFRYRTRAEGAEIPEGAEIEVFHLSDPETVSDPPPEAMPSNTPAPTP